MGDKSAISWCDATWNPVLGCEKVSEGCRRCYAIRVAHKLAAFGQAPYQGLTRVLPDGSLNWTGTVRCLPERLALPLRWKRPRRIFVNSMSDLFHPDVPDGFIAQVFSVMAHAQRHTFQILTKRPERMARLIGSPDFSERVCGAANWNPNVWPWPLPNVWPGTSCENQAAADERIPHLLRTPAAVRFLSCEPLLGPIDLWSAHYPWPDGGAGMGNAFAWGQGIHWVIGGGESGPGYRPLDLDWARSLRDDCQAAGVAFFFKQSSGPRPGLGRELDGRTHEEFPAVREAVGV